MVVDLSFKNKIMSDHYSILVLQILYLSNKKLFEAGLGKSMPSGLAPGLGTKKHNSD